MSQASARNPLRFINTHTTETSPWVLSCLIASREQNKTKTGKISITMPFQAIEPYRMGGCKEMSLTAPLGRCPLRASITFNAW